MGLLDGTPALPGQNTAAKTSLNDQVKSLVWIASGNEKLLFDLCLQFFHQSVGPSVGRSVGPSVGRSVGRSVGAACPKHALRKRADWKHAFIKHAS